MKKTGKLIAGVLVLGILGGSYVILKNHNEKAENTEEAEEEEAVEIAAISSEEIAQLAFTLDDGDVIFKKENDTWKNQLDSDFPLNEDKITDMTEQLSSIKADRVLENVDDLAEYGLDEPQNEIKIMKQDGEQQMIYIGNKNQVTNQYYVQINDNKEDVYVVSSSVVTPFSGKLYDFAQMESLPVIDSGDVKDIIVEKEENPYILEASTEVSSGWMVGKDKQEMEAADSANAYTLIASIGTLAYDDFVDYHCENMEDYGLEKPYAVLTVNYTETVEKTEDEETADSTDASEDGEAEATDDAETSEQVDDIENSDDTAEGDEAAQTADAEENIEVEEQKIDRQLILNIGDACENGRYVNREGSKEVYVISEDTLSAILDKQVSDFYDLTVSYVPIARLKQLTVVENGTETVVDAVEEIVEPEEEEEETSDESEEEEEEEEQQTETVYYAGDKKLDSLTFKTFYSSAVNQAAQSRYEEEYEPETQPELVLSFVKDDGTTVGVSYYSYDGSFYMAVRNDGKMYLVNKMNIKQLIEAWEKVGTE